MKNGKFSKSPLQQAIEHAKSNKLLPGESYASLNENLYDKTKCYKADFGRESIPNIETGSRVYFCKNIGGGYSVEKDNVNISGVMSFGGGVNLASGEVTSSVGSSRLDVEGPRAQVLAEAHAISNTTANDFKLSVKVGAHASKVAGETRSKEKCLNDYCYNIGFTPYLGIGGGMELGAGYYQNTQTDKKSFTVSAGNW